ncbi:MAG: hypothetical protein HQL20_06175 [Candidatus Omnitrophica bacterium]|nr:hypothetical protein [Candidatus Omnitrophota bacterium]
MKKPLFFFAAAGLLALFYAVQFLVPAYIQSLFVHGQFTLLNLFTGVSGPQSLDFYLGRGEELLWGPAVQVISGLMLILITLGALKNISTHGFFWLMLGFLILTKWNVLLFPPYGDSVGGPFAEGWWLAQNNFDYAGLLREPGYAAGGPRVYFTSAFPTYLALMYKAFSSMPVFLVVNHLVFFAMAAAVAAWVRSVARQIFCSESAGLLAAVILSWPIFQTQLEAINMELPCLFFAMAAAWALTRGQIHKAGVAALLSLAFKGAGIFACAGFVVIALLEIRREGRYERRAAWIWWSIALLALCGLSVGVKYWLGDQHTTGTMIAPFAGWPSLKIFAITWFYLANIAVLAAAWVLRRRVSGPWTACFAVDKTSWRANRVMLVFAGMWFLLFLNFMVLAPRYRVAVYPFLLFSLFWTFTRLVPQRGWQVAVLVITLLTVQFNSYGVNNTYIPPDYVLLEENLQYRNDLRLYQKLARVVEDKYAGAATVVAPFIAAQKLAVPAFGYVRANNGRDVVIYGFPCVYGGVRAYPGLEALDVRRTIYTTMDIDQGSKERPYPLHPNDKVLEVVECGNRKAWIFMGGFAIDLMRKMQNYMLMQQRARKI